MSHALDASLIEAMCLCCTQIQDLTAHHRLFRIFVTVSQSELLFLEKTVLFLNI